MGKDKSITVRYFSAAEEGSFAEFTVSNRFEKIFKDYCSGSYEEFLSKKLSSYDSDSFPDNVKNDFLKIYEKKRNCICGIDKPEKITINEDLTLGEIFKNAPFLEAEIIFYHALLAEKKYFKNSKNDKEKIKNYDFFASEKKNSVISEKKKFIETLDKLAENTSTKLDKKEFQNAMHYCLSANTSDLSQLNAKERFKYKIDEIKILKDDSLQLFEYLKHKQASMSMFERFDIICDNAGKELFSDLYLACYFLKNELVKKVIFHLKPYPFFVSDATEADFGYLIREIQAEGKGSGAELCTEYICTNKIEIEADAFWASPLCFNNKSSPIIKELKKSDLIIIKGDLNYRRLVQDCNWDYTDTFLERTKNVFGNAPLVAPRVLKSDVLIGIDNASYHFAKSTDELNAPADKSFKGNGKWAVIQCRIPDSVGITVSGNDRECETKPSQSEKSEDDKESHKAHTLPKEGWFSKLLYCSVYGILILLLVSLLVMSIKTMNDAKYCPSPDNSNRIDFSLLFTGYGFLLTGTVLIPKFLLKEKIKEEFLKQKEAMSQELKEIILTKIEPDLSYIKAEKFQMDADFSRMVAFLLEESNPIWALGWALHSLKRYIESEQNRKRKEMPGFILVLFSSVIKPTIRKTVSVILDDKNDSQFDDVFKLEFNDFLRENSIANRLVFLIYKESNSRFEPDKLRAALSLIKDAADIEYGIKHNVYKLDSESDFYNKCDEISKYIGAFIRFIVFALIKFTLENRESNKPSKKLFDTKQAFISKIFSLSKNEMNDDYKKELSLAVSHIAVDVFSENQTENMSEKRIRSNLTRIYPKNDGEDTYLINKIYFLTNKAYFFPIVE